MKPVHAELPSLAERYRGYFAIGAAVGKRRLAVQGELIRQHCNSMTAENAMKFESLQPAEGVWRFEEADFLAAAALSQGCRMRGHCLVWHQQTPDWVFRDGAGDASKDRLLSRMENHIATVVGRYRGRVAQWDVVNEAVPDKEAGSHRQSAWWRIAGPEYVERAFHAAHRADPEALLFYNDYNETDEPKRSRIIELLTDLKRREVPVHGMGMQGHYGPDYPPLDEIRRSIEAYAALGLQIEITELDLSVYRWNHGPSPLTSPTAEMLDKQAARYDGLFSLFRQYAGVISGVTFWAMADDSTWLDNFPVPGRKNWPSLFDIHHQPKAAFHAVTKPT